MTHGMFGFVPMWMLTLFVVAAIALPAFVVAGVIHRFNEYLGYVSGVIVAGIWAKSYLLILEYGRLEQEAAKAADCMGYAQLPERCWSVMNGPQVIPENFYLWVTPAFFLTFLGLAIVWYWAIDWDKYRRKWGKFCRALRGLVPV